MKKEVTVQPKATYFSPDVAVVDIETEQNILVSGSIPDLPGEDC